MGTLHKLSVKAGGLLAFGMMLIKIGLDLAMKGVYDWGAVYIALGIALIVLGFYDFGKGLVKVLGVKAE